MLVDLIDKLVDRLIQLVQHRQEARHKLLQEHVVPIFQAFEAVHAQYLSSFAKYRKTLKTTTDPLTESHPVFDEISTDNLFSEHDRTRIIHLGSLDTDPEVRALVKLIYDYLVDVRVASDPIGGYQGGRFANPQHWRRTLLAELKAIFSESWQVVLDPNSAQPPLYDSALQDALAEVRKNAGIREDDPDRQEKLKAVFAVRAVDEVVQEMQNEYARVSMEYGRLRQALSG